MEEEQLKRLFWLYMSPESDPLCRVLEGVQKREGPGDWKQYVNDIMDAMELRDAGLFPDEWLSVQDES
jgi:hypothetical protein